MPADEYASTVRGGLKLKGGAPAGIKKKKKKPKNSEAKTSALQVALGDDDAAVAGSEDAVKKGKGPEEAEKNDDERDEDLYEGKTASERAYEEMRKKRLLERLEKEGVKSHKERVEGLNKYLSKLSEHHDMPRIGPG